MILDKNTKINKVFGTFDLSDGPTKIFDRTIQEFLSSLSKTILKSNEAKKYPDLISLGFWCRKSNIEYLKKEYLSEDLRIGRGIILHITPSNIPMTFAYSLFFGLLSGNQNIVRIPSKNFYQIKLLVNFFNQILKKKKYKLIKKKFVLITYKNSDEISASLSKFVDGRIIWGGDNTVKKFKSFETSPRCIDLYFADRYSGCIINLNSLKKLKKDKIEKVCNDLYSDCYLMDQMGCSSPTVIFWIGSVNQKLKDKFWDIFSKIVDKRYEFDLSAANKKLSNLTKLVLTNQVKLVTNYKKFNILRINTNTLTEEMINLNPKFGSFYEIVLPNLKKLENYVDKKFQTLLYYGVDKKDIENLIIKKNLKGIDRVVPFGRAFDLSTKWDGYDIVLNLSRIIST